MKDLNDLYELALEENNTDIQNEVSQNIFDLKLLVKKNEINVSCQMKQILWTLRRNTRRCWRDRKSRLGRYA